MSTMGALESFGGLIFVFESSVVGRAMLVVWPEDAAAGFAVGCSAACSDGVVTTGVLVSDLFLR